MERQHTGGREAALQYLYMHDLLAEQGAQTFDEWLALQQPCLDVGSRAFAEQLVAAVIKHRPELDPEISAAADNWDIARMAVVERNILRLALAELLTRPGTSYKIIIDEAVDLAKRFSSEEAGAFVNGLLDKLCQKLRPGIAEEKSEAAAETTDAPQSAQSTQSTETMNDE